MNLQELMRRLKKSQLSMVEKLTKDNPELDLKGHSFLHPWDPKGMQWNQYLRIMKLEGIGFNWKKQ